MHVLVICDDNWHPGDIVRKGLNPLQNNNFEFDFIFDANEFDKKKLSCYPIIIFSKSNNVSRETTDPWVTSDVENAFTTYVENGGGLLVIHSGTAGYKKNKDFSNLIGGVFNHHPLQCDVTIEACKNNSIIDEDIKFRVFDEHYFMNMEDENVDVFMNTISMSGKQPGGWTKSVGKGRICVLTPGHNLKVWLNEDFQNILKSCLNWCVI